MDDEQLRTLGVELLQELSGERLSEAVLKLARAALDQKKGTPQ
jgi:hypothetical protein